jgi:hypothetical protein
MKKILFCNARDEQHILEWIVHHLNLGFDHIYIFDHLSKIPISEIIKKTNISKFVTVSRIEDEILLKYKLVEKSYKIAKFIYDWMIYLDCDEFLYFKNDNNIETFLNNYSIYDQIAINWVMFGSNNLDLYKNGTILENYTKCENKLDKCVKTFLNLDKLRKIDKKIIHFSAHYYLFDDMNDSITVNFKKMNKKDGGYGINIDKNDDYKNISCYIAHYIYQSYDTYYSRKVKLRRDDNFKFRAVESASEIHSKYNNVENFDLLNKYNNINKKKLKEIFSIFNLFD